MKMLKRFALWYWLLTKRLLKKPVFLVLLICVPLLAGAMAAAARQDSGIVTVALVCRTEEIAARRAADRLLTADSLVRCVEYASEEAARDAVARGTVDAAWIFRDTVAQELQRFITRRGSRGAVLVVEREDNVFLRLAREQLAAALYPEASFTLFRDYLVNEMGVPADISDETLEYYYSVRVAEDPIIVFAHADGSAQPRTAEYLTAPVRGLLALLLVLTGLASGMYYYREAENETFLRLSAAKRRFLPLLYHLTALLPMALATLLALRATGLLTGWLRETGLMLLYCLSVAAFCELLRRLCRGEARLGALIPVLLAAMLALCPVFLDLKVLEPLRRLFPPFFYLNGIHSARSAGWLAVYTCAAALLAVLLPDRERN